MSSVVRISSFYSRHGFRATIRRAALQAKRALFSGRMVVFYCDLGTQTSVLPKAPAPLQLERVRTLAELSPADLQAMTIFWNPKQARRNIEERFAKGATLWLVKSGETLAGYGWTLQGQTMEPYYFPLGQEDVQLFDFYVFPKFRGRALHWLLTLYVLRTLAAEGRARAFADTGEWNQAQLAAFNMTPFRRLGLARTIKILGHKFTRWSQEEPSAKRQRQAAGAHNHLVAARSNER